VSESRVFGVLTPSRVIGDYAYKHELPNVLLNRPEIQRMKISEDDKFFFIASDGLWGYVSNEEATKIAHNSLAKKGVAGASAALVSAAQDGGSHDDVTAIVVLLHKE
jgi:serine/threonine protein phosphatase PrpC